MTRVLIPFSEPQGAARAVAMLIGEAPDRRTSVHLLAAVEPRVSGKVILYLSPDHAEALVARGRGTLARAAGGDVGCGGNSVYVRNRRRSN